MKKTILFTMLALLGMIQAAAQEYEYVPFVREGVKWVCDAPYIDWDYWMNRHNFFTLELKGDTIDRAYQSVPQAFPANARDLIRK